MSEPVPPRAELRERGIDKPNVPFLTCQWLELFREKAKSLFPSGSWRVEQATTCLQMIVTDVPDQPEFRFFLDLEAGRLADIQPGNAAEPRLVATIGYDDLIAYLHGELDEATAYVRGRLKIHGKELDAVRLYPLVSAPEYRAALNAVVAETAF